MTHALLTARNRYVEMINVAHKNLVYDLAHHESPIAQWSERPALVSGKSLVRLPLGFGKFFFRFIRLEDIS